MVVLTFDLALPPSARATQFAPDQNTTAAKSQSFLTLEAALREARAASPALRAAQEAVAKATALERQSSAFNNPTFVYGREQTSRLGQSNAQDIALVEQPLEVSGQRAARRASARAQREIAEARLGFARVQLEFDVAKGFAQLVSATRRAGLAAEAMRMFAEAERVFNERLAAGDVSGYAARRIGLESARYAAQHAELALALRTARMELATLLAWPTDSVKLSPRERVVPDPASGWTMPTLDSLRQLALHTRADLRAHELDVVVADADARLVAAARIPIPVFSAGYKRESVNDGGIRGPVGLTGFVAGLSIPLPIFDRRDGSVAAMRADARRLNAEATVMRQRVAREVEDAFESVRAVDAQLALLRPQLGERSDAAVRAVRTAYAEGEITLVEFLDTVRAYQDAESILATLSAEGTIRRAALERAVGISLFAGNPQ